ncbi:MAG: autotransporter outer membrane beta-barrel domain-containing protein, partial [Rhodocyclaceae bacterium]|nr:autotransporter outer membrane beta-barrel domain-containing protein [Rhodocyclaceae bacterium]
QIVRMTGNLPNRTGGGAPNFGGSDNKGAGAPSDTTAFARFSGYDQKAETGSHVNVNGATAIVGAAKVVPLAGGGTAAVGAFFEYGDGSFKTHNGFDTGDVNGKGNSDYYGAGVLARVNLAPKGSADGGGAPIVEGSVHAGRIHNNWHTDDLRDAATGARAQYDIRTPYMGGHVGAGYRWQTNDTTQVEVFGQNQYTHMDGKDTTVALDPYHFKAVKSSRTRLGAKGTWAVSNTTNAYAGAAWEREFDGTARATAYSFDVPAPTMKGNSAVIDAGLTFQPKRNLSANVGVTGYAGKRKGVAANVEVQYLF